MHPEEAGVTMGLGRIGESRLKVGWIRLESEGRATTTSNNNNNQQSHPSLLLLLPNLQVRFFFLSRSLHFTPSPVLVAAVNDDDDEIE